MSHKKSELSELKDLKTRDACARVTILSAPNPICLIWAPDLKRCIHAIEPLDFPTRHNLSLSRVRFLFRGCYFWCSSWTMIVGKFSGRLWTGEKQNCPVFKTIGIKWSLWIFETANRRARPVPTYQISWLVFSRSIEPKWLFTWMRQNLCPPKLPSL